MSILIFLNPVPSFIGRDIEIEGATGALSDRNGKHVWIPLPGFDA